MVGKVRQQQRSPHDSLFSKCPYSLKCVSLAAGYQHASDAYRYLLHAKVVPTIGDSTVSCGSCGLNVRSGRLSISIKVIHHLSVKLISCFWLRTARIAATTTATSASSSAFAPGCGGSFSGSLFGGRFWLSALWLTTRMSADVD